MLRHVELDSVSKESLEFLSCPETFPGEPEEQRQLPRPGKMRRFN